MLDCTGLVRICVVTFSLAWDISSPAVWIKLRTLCPALFAASRRSLLASLTFSRKAEAVFFRLETLSSLAAVNIASLLKVVGVEMHSFYNKGGDRKKAIRVSKLNHKDRI